MSDDRLYHGSSLKFDTLRLTDWEQTKNGVNGLWAFATHLRSHALPYTFSGLPDGRARWRLMNTVEIDAHRSLTMVYSEHAEHFRQPFEGYLHRLPRQAFQRVMAGGSFINEWISPKPVPLIAEDSERISSFEQVMSEGVQLFSSTRRKSDEEMLRLFDGMGVKRACAALVRSGDLTWENGLTGLGCAPEFDDLMPRVSRRPSCQKGLTL